MAFTIQTWCRASTSANEPFETLASGALAGCFRQYNYVTADTQAVVGVSGYFNTVAFDLTTGDYINVYSTADAFAVVYRVTNTAGVITLTAVGGAVQNTLTMTAVQVDAMYGAPFQLLPAPGANKMYVIDQVGFSLVYAGVQFAGGGAIAVQYSNTVHGGGTLATATLAGATFDGLTASSTFTLVPVTIAPVAVALMANQGLFLSNDTAAFTAGTNATLLVSTRARIVATAQS